jgi:hypothetical protein
MVGVDGDLVVVTVVAGTAGEGSVGAVMLKHVSVMLR